MNEESRGHIAQAEGVTLPLDSVDYTSSGVFGRSTNASAEKGKRVLEAVIQELVKHVNALKEARFEDLVQKPKV